MEPASGRAIGSSRFHGYDEAADEVVVGWTFLARSHWGGQYNGEMKRLMLDHAFRYVGRVVFLIDPANHRSQRAIEKIGVVRAGLTRGWRTMHDFTIVDLGGLVAAGWVLVRVLGPVATALAKRIEGRGPTTADDPAVPQLREELEELHERIDFLERALAARQPPTELPQGRTPV
jgi:hypothetical protein